MYRLLSSKRRRLETLLFSWVMLMRKFSNVQNAQPQRDMFPSQVSTIFNLILNKLLKVTNLMTPNALTVEKSLFLLGKIF